MGFHLKLQNWEKRKEKIHAGDCKANDERRALKSELCHVYSGLTNITVAPPG